MIKQKEVMTRETGRQNAALALRRFGLLCVAGVGASVLAAVVLENWEKGLTNKGALDFFRVLLGKKLAA